ncbi:MAG: type II toxin-antitoxin system RelE/ParE family toxin [Bacteroidales bacterium]|jgi:plasmid stabilization system protein ParE|nr:type II toxin-antitoxin system RelE/ParE family toxin [Bacteroidales bacterium]
MTTYKIRIDDSAESDLRHLFDFLINVMSRDGANRYIDMITNEVLSLSILANVYSPSQYADIRRYHPQARRMVSHNKRWVYIFHIEDDSVIIDRILPAKLITK